jgi:hypothetical protein
MRHPHAPGREEWMPVFDRLIELPLLRTIYVAFAAFLAILFAIACVVAILNFNWTSRAESPAEWLNGVALGISALVALVVAHQRPMRSLARVFWWAIAVGLIVYAAEETFDLFERMDRAWADDDYVDLIVLFITPIGLYLACVIEFVPRISKNAMKCGFAFQCLSDLFDIGDGRLYDVHLFDHSLIETLTELSELLFIETYLFGLLCLLLSIVARGLATSLPRVATL